MYRLHWHWLYVSTTWPWPFSNHLLNITQFLTKKKNWTTHSHDDKTQWCLVWIVESRPRFGSSFPAEGHGRNLSEGETGVEAGKKKYGLVLVATTHDTGDSVCQCQINNQQINNSTFLGASVNSWFKHGCTIDGCGHWYYQLKSK